MKLLILAVVSWVALAAFAAETKKNWGKVDGKDVYLFTFANKNGMEVAVTNYGATVQAIRVPDKNGRVDDVALGYDTLAGYQEKNNPYFGTIVGRVGNRIAKGRFTLDGHEYKLPLNNKTNTLHGGYKGFDKQVWDVKDTGPDHVTLHYVSKDGEEGFPGDLDTTVKYTLTADSALVIEFTVTTDKPTVQNMTNHTYFNLAGQGNGDVMKQVISINADRFTTVDKELIPTGEIEPVAGTPFDFRTPHAIGERIGADNEQLRFGGGYDHNWVLDDGSPFAARAWEPSSGRLLTMWTTEPGLQFYSGNHLGDPFTGFALEAHIWPNAPNRPDFPSTVLRPGEVYHQETAFELTTSDEPPVA